MALCGGCNVVHPYAAFIIGGVGGITYIVWSAGALYFKVDDPLDAVASKKIKTIFPLGRVFRVSK